MACRTKTYQVSRNVWSDGTTTAPGLYHSLLRLKIAEWAKARVSLITEGASGSVTVASAAAYGDDETEVDGATPAAFPATPTSINNNNSAYGAGYEVFDLDFQLVDMGVRCINSSGTKMEHVRVTIVVDVSEEG